MTNQRKKPDADLKKSYPVYLEAGLIVALLFMIIAVKVQVEDAPPAPPPAAEQEVVKMEEIVQTQQQETPPPPARPQVPVEVPNDEVIEDDIIEFDSEFDLDGPIDLPPPPAPEEEEEEDDFFVVVENMPELIGGMKKLQAGVKYPEMARRAGIEGRVTVQFIVNERGEVENAHVVRGIGGGCDEEALRAVKNAKFKPGRQRGRPVRVQYALSVNFRLQN
ncbi:MAG: energy transducer TonB [Balneolaceae bacterium]|nr:energy transducer TonB [Balneolaceae bacterium]